jgi:hypothetical protein
MELGVEYSTRFASLPEETSLFGQVLVLDSIAEDSFVASASAQGEPRTGNYIDKP